MNEYSYLILVEVLAMGPMSDLVIALQSAYDDGADGKFQIVPTQAPGYLVTFLRSTAEDDMQYLRDQMKKGAETIQLAAMRQLGEELLGAGDAAAMVVLDLLNGDAHVIDFAEALTREDETN